MAIPVFIGCSVSQINLFVDKYLAFSLALESVAALNYDNTLNGMIAAFSIIILATMIYPKHTQANATDNIDRLDELVQAGFNLIFSLPISICAMIYNDEIVQIIFERG